MNKILFFIQDQIYLIVFLGATLQIFGTFILGLFSFFGLREYEDKEVYMEGTYRVTIHKGWKIAAQIGLLSLLFGIALSTAGSLASLAPTK